MQAGDEPIARNRWMGGGAMVSAWWLLVAASAGVGVGMFLFALLTIVTGRDADMTGGDHVAHPLA